MVQPSYIGAARHRRSGYVKPISNRRIERLKPLIMEEIELRYADSEYFTKDHILYFTCLRQFSMAYRISLIREVVKHFEQIGRLIRYNRTDYGMATSANIRRFRTMQKNHDVAYAGSYTTRAADELLDKRALVSQFDSKWLAGWLSCLEHLAEKTKYNYARRIIEDLIRRGVLVEHSGFQYTLNEDYR